MQTFTLPVEADLAMSAEEAKGAGSLLSEDFNQAEPFPHIVLDEFFPQAVLQRVLDGFPARPLEHDRTFEMGYAGQNKRQVLPEDCRPDIRELFWFMNSRPMLQFLEGLTGIDGLLPDPYFLGGGFHETTRGGLLGVHADFRIHEPLRLQRRLNLIVYLNETWDDNWLGQLELWDRKMTTCVQKVSPILNRCVVFRTDADTWHGHPDALQTPDGVSRRSMALYYYTASEAIHEEVPPHSTVYVPRNTDSAAIKSEARKLRNWEHARDWLPPVLYRKLSRLRYR